MNGMNGMGGAIDLSQLAQQQQMHAAGVQDLNLNVSIHVFARLAGDWFAKNPEAPPDAKEFKVMGDKARLIAPFLAKSYGLIDYELTVKPNKAE